jgi:hypothetical protein
MPQFKRERVFVIADAWDGLRQILWGLFKKGAELFTRWSLEQDQ